VSPVPVTALSEDCGSSVAGTVGLNPAGGINVCCEWYVGRRLCDWPITCTGESYEMRARACVYVCVCVCVSFRMSLCVIKFRNNSLHIQWASRSDWTKNICIL
jgi:hypothetical protein